MTESFFKNKHILFGFIIIILLLIMAMFSSEIASQDPYVMSLEDRLISPNSDHIFGTDRFGRDVFSRTVFGSRISLMIGFSVSFLSIFCGIILGAIAGYFKKLDPIMMRILDAFMAFPNIVLLIILIASFGQNIINVIIALVFVYIPRTARVVRSAILSESEKSYVEAAKALGFSELRIVFLHIMPNCTVPIIIQFTMIFAYAILSEAGLSFLGVGLQPEIPSWGNMIGEGKSYLASAPWISLFPGMTISLCILGINMFADGLRDITDPKFKER